MSPEQGSSAEELYSEHKSAAKKLENVKGWETAESDDLAAAQENQAEVAADTIGSEEIDRRNAAQDVSEQTTRLAEARDLVDRTKIKYDDNIARGKARSADFIDEAGAMDKMRTEGNPPA